jgi:hypothetical protein
VFCDRLGQLVRREELEQLVWDMKPGTQSETAPVTVRSLRRKLSWTGSFPLETVRGVGWRLHPPPSGLPRFRSPYHPRPTAEARLSSLLDDGWRLVTVHGLGGIGKTRLAVAVAASRPEDVLHVPIADGLDVDGLVQTVLTAAGIDGEDLGALPALCLLLDGADRSWDAVRGLLEQHDVRALVTSRRALGLPGEAVFRLGPLPHDAARAFLRTRRVTPTDDVTLDRVAAALQGVPLALELAARRPGDLGLPSDSPEADQLAGIYRASLEALSPPLLDTLGALSLVRGRLDEGLLDRWRPQGRAHVRELARHALVDPVEGGWSMLATTRAAVQARPLDWQGLRRSHAAFVDRTIRSWKAGLYADPVRSSRERVGLSPDVEHHLDHAEGLPELAWTLLRHHEFRGPRLGALRLARQCRLRLGDHALPRLLEIMHLGRFERWPEVPEDADPHTRVLEVTVRGFFAPTTVDLDAMDRLLPTLDPVLRHRVQHGRTFVMRAHGLVDQARRELSNCLRVATSDLERAELLRTLAMASVDVDLHAALELVADASALVAPLGLPVLAARIRALHDTYLAHLDPRRAAESALEHAAAIERTLPREHRLVRGFAGFLLAGLGDDARALPLLDAAASDPSSWSRSHLAAAAAAIRLRADDPSQADRIRALEPQRLNLQRRDGSSCADQVHAFLLAEIALYEARRVGREQEALAEILAVREAAFREDDDGFCHAAIDTLRRRFSHLFGTSHGSRP